MRYLLAFAFFLLSSNVTYAWNSTGHQLVAQIAYDNLRPDVKQQLNVYNRAVDGKSRYSSFVKSAVWLDVLKQTDVHWYDHLHYIDIPYTKDGTPLPKADRLNAYWAIKKAMLTLQSQKASKRDKGLSLRMLIHIVGDIHQPLHTITQVSKSRPQGDLGGNLFILADNPAGANLHKYWDTGAGMLLGSRKPFQIKNKARQLEKRWSCKKDAPGTSIKGWIDASHQLAIQKAYAVSEGTIPSSYYQMSTQNLVEKQIFAAGCHLAYLLNGMHLS